jgi:prolyl-tRNA editing enzyme YbaK/EbsC (Cys-tRNA(Pro) deacylase)
MAIDKVKQYLQQWQAASRIHEFATSSATVELAAAALGCAPARIAKSLTFAIGDRSILLVTAGDTKVDNQKYRAFFGAKAQMLAADEVLRRIGHEVGGVCPFGVNPDVEIYLDESLYRFTTVYPAGGSCNSVIELTLPELELFSRYRQRINVCKGWL